MEAMLQKTGLEAVGDADKSTSGQQAEQVLLQTSLEGTGGKKSDDWRNQEAQQILLQNSLEAFGQKKSDSRRDHDVMCCLHFCLWHADTK